MGEYMIMKKEQIFLIILLLCTFLIRIYNANELSGGDDSEYAQLSVFAIESKEKIIYPSFPDEPMSYGGYYYARPFAVIPIIAPILILGYNKYAILMPTLIFSVLSVLLLYLIVKRQFNTKIAFIASILFAFSPFHIAFTRNGFLHGALVFYCLLATYLVVRAIDEKRNLFIYLAAFACLINAWTTDFRGLVPLIALAPYVYLRDVDKKQLKHFFYAGIIVLGLFFVYMLIPLIFFNSPRFLQSFINMFVYAVSGTTESVLGGSMTLYESIIFMIKYLVMTPFVGLIFIPMTFGVVYLVNDIKKPECSMWLFWLLSILVFYMQGKPYVERQLVIVPAFAVLASVGLVYSLKNRFVFPLLFASTSSWIVFMVSKFPSTYPEVYQSLSQYSFLFYLLSKYYIIIIGVIFLFSVFLVFRRKKQTALLLAYLILNACVASALVVGGFGIYSRTDEVKVVADYLNENIGDEKYACVAGVHDKSFIFYTQRLCASWRFINVSWIEEQVENNNLKYFVLNLYLYDGYTPGFGRIDQSGVVDNTSCIKLGQWHCNEPEKYNWLMKNTLDITYKTGLKPDNPYFRLYEYKGDFYEKN